MTLSNSFFGIAAPKFVHSSTTYLLDHVVILKDEPETEFIRHESIINRHREWVPKGTHWIYQVNLLLFKYADPSAKYAELKALERANVSQLFRRRDGAPIKDASNADVEFRIDSINETYIDRYDYPDVLTITFKSVDYVEMEKSAIAP